MRRLPHSSAGKSSVVSVCTSFIGEEYCFKSDAVVKTKSGSGADVFQHADQLQKGSLVWSADSTALLKVAEEPKSYKTARIFELIAGDAYLNVTRSHRMPTCDGPGMERREKLAMSLRVGDFVFVNGEAVRLHSVNELVLMREVEVVRLVFSPDLPVGVFSEPRTIESYGSRRQKSRGGGSSTSAPRSGGEAVENAQLQMRAAAAVEHVD